MPTSIETAVVRVADGTEMRVYYAKPAKLPAPGILLLPEVFGINPYIQDTAAKLAEAGYLAVAPELFHRTAPPGWTGSYTDFSTVMPHYQAVTDANLEADLRAAHEWLKSHADVQAERIGAIGFCLGGRCAFMANAFLPLQAAVSFYGGNIAPSLLPLAARQQAPLVLFWGGKDEHIGLEATRQIAQALRDAKRPFTEVLFSEADHGFHCHARASHHPEAARAAWALTLEFLKLRLQE